ncbi:MAG: CPBP family intramembrane metalloprotease [Polyangiaceae bacterium]|nr:CPBP family intramembrane metalloprotease [Polyangiaceae bacterium]
MSDDPRDGASGDAAAPDADELDGAAALGERARARGRAAREARGAPARPPSPLGWRIAVLVAAVVAGTYAWAARDAIAGEPVVYYAVLIPYGALAAGALYRLWSDGTLADRLRLRGGDFTIGAVTAAVLLVGGWLLGRLVAPSGSPRQLWALRLEHQLGQPDALQHSVGLTAALLGIAICEELVWRGLVLELLAERVGPRLGWVLAALLYGAAFLPAAATLRVPIAGPNPLPVLGALGAGFVWSFLAARSGRLTPGVFSHAALAYFGVAVFRVPPG